MDSHQRGPVTRKEFLCHDVIMRTSNYGFPTTYLAQQTRIWHTYPINSEMIMTQYVKNDGMLSLLVYDNMPIILVMYINSFTRKVSWCSIESRAPFQYPIRRLIVRSRVSKSQSREIGSLDYRIALEFDRHIASSAAEVPHKLQSDRTILNTNLAASRLCEIIR